MNELIFSDAIPSYETNNKTRFIFKTRVNIKLVYCPSV